jgi:hypothetical protein
MPKPYIITPEIIAKCEGLAAQGLTMEQIASVLGMGCSTLYEKQNEYPELLEAIKRGRHKGVATISNALFQKAKAGDNTAMIFYLKNRSPEEWRDRREHEHSGSKENPVEIVLNYVAEDDDDEDDD